MVKRILALVLSGLTVLALSACGNGAARSSVGSDAGLKAAESTQSAGISPSKASQGQVKIEITPPSGWEPVQGSVLPVQYLKGTASFMVKEEGMFSAKTTDDVIKEAKGYFEKSFKDISYEGEPTALTVDGKEAREIAFRCTVSSLKMKYRYVYLFAGGNVYAITFGDAAERFDSLAADYSQILKDIRFR